VLPVSIITTFIGNTGNVRRRIHSWEGSLRVCRTASSARFLASSSHADLPSSPRCSFRAGTSSKMLPASIADICLYLLDTGMPRATDKLQRLINMPLWESPAKRTRAYESPPVPVAKLTLGVYVLRSYTRQHVTAGL